MNKNFAAALIVVMAWCVSAFAQDTVRVRPFVRAEPGQRVTLADVAEIKGDGAASVGAVVLIDALGTDHRVTMTMIRAALEKSGVNLGRVVISGSECELRHGDTKREDAPESKNTDESGPEEVAVSAAGLTSPDIRAAIGAKLAELYGVEPDHLRLTFEQRDSATLSVSTVSKTIAVQPAAGGKRVPVQFRVYDEDRLERSGTVRVGIEILRDVLVTVSPVRRGEAIAPESFTHDQRWLTPDIKPAAYDDAVGSLALAKIESGAVVEDRMVQPPTCVAKGDICQVDCLARGIAVQGQGRALEAAREGQVIRFQSMNSKKVFRARVSGPGRAVMQAAER